MKRGITKTLYVLVVILVTVVAIHIAHLALEAVFRADNPVVRMLDRIDIIEYITTRDIEFR